MEISHFLKPLNVKSTIRERYSGIEEDNETERSWEILERQRDKPLGEREKRDWEKARLWGTKILWETERLRDRDKERYSEKDR